MEFDPVHVTFIFALLAIVLSQTSHGASRHPGGMRRNRTSASVSRRAAPWRA